MSDTLAYLFSVKGRINRFEYLHCLLLGVLLAMMGGLLAALVALIVASIADVPPGKIWWANPAVYGVLPAVLICGGVWLTAMIRRWRDVGVSAWVAVLLFVLMLGTDWDLLILALPALIPSSNLSNTSDASGLSRPQANAEEPTPI